VRRTSISVPDLAECGKVWAAPKTVTGISGQSITRFADLSPYPRYLELDFWG
jgi:hypothetical protein